MKIIATPSRTKEILEKFDLYAKKNYGQNFLIEPGIVSKIARHAVISDHCIVIEIGPGIGALTQMLSKEAKKVIAFEIDERLDEVLAYSLEGCDNVEIILQDFMEIDLKEWVERYPDDDVVIAANLPYYITTPILFKIFESDANIKRITVMMQKEVADRFSATVNSKDYNALSVITQYLTHVKQVVKVPRNVFNPKPNVDSAVLQFEFKERDSSIHEELFFEMVKACFKQRRKTILNNFGEWCKDKEKARIYLEDVNIDCTRRAESCTCDEFLKLYRRIEHEKICICEN
ncbi:MAG: 16S rRNA (adenine(1518)-N(6)/adenine(1519)-N(6))-dimethyltransferase RsmA [Traorella sp.]